MALVRKDPFATARSVQDGDLVIVYVSLQNMFPVVVKKGKSFQNKFGEFKFDDFIGKHYGGKV